MTAMTTDERIADLDKRIARIKMILDRLIDAKARLLLQKEKEQ